MPATLDRIDDPALPTLVAVLDPAQLGEYLRQASPWASKASQEVRVRVLRYHPGKRCVVDITVQAPHGSLGLIGKVYATDRSDICKLMEAISAEGFGPGETFSVPQPTVYLQPLRLLLQEKVEGKPATDSFLSDDGSERVTAAERCGRWLAKFHAITPYVGPCFQLGSYLGLLEQWSHRMASLGEPFADKSRTLFRQLQATASLLCRTETCAIHGDFTHHQVVFRKNSTVTVDWDNYALGDPMRDVARFMVGLKRLALRSLASIRALDEAGETFLRTCAAAHRADGAASLAFHKAAACLEHAKHDVHKRADGWRQRAETTLDEGLRILELGV